jgi:hypothetical protein
LEADKNGLHPTGAAFLSSVIPNSIRQEHALKMRQKSAQISTWMLANRCHRFIFWHGSSAAFNHDRFDLTEDPVTAVGDR